MDSILKLRQLVDEFWNNKKEFDYTNIDKKRAKTLCNKLRKHAIEINELHGEVMKEIDLYEQMHTNKF